VPKSQRLLALEHLAVGYALAPFVRVAGPKTRFCIIAAARSGSNLLVSLLDGHPDAVCEGEILRYRGLGVRMIRWSDGRAVTTRLRRRVAAYGWKATIAQVMALPEPERSTFLPVLHRRGYQIVVLRREDELARAVSMVQGRDSGVWHHRAGREVSAGATAVDPADLHAMLSRGRRELEFLDAALDGVPHLGLTYEHDLETSAAQQATLGRLCTAFGLPDVPAVAGYVRGGGSSLRDRIANYEEVMAALRSGEFAALADPAPPTSRDATTPPPRPTDG
jgi:hypothetical protein